MTIRLVLLVALVGSFVLLLQGGCEVAGIAARAIPPPTVQAQYKGLAGKSVGVMVWADRGTRIEWPTIQLDLAKSIQANLDQTARTGKSKELLDTTFPHKPESIVRYQSDYPHIESMPVAEVAPQLKVQRLVYVEIESFSTRAPGAIALYRGQATASVQVVEVTDGQGTIAYEESGITTIFPTGVREEGIPNADDYKIYRGTINQLAAQIAQRFVSYQQEEW